MAKVMPKTLASIIRDNAETMPDKTAIIYADSRYSYLEHYLRALKLADSLFSLGCNVGDRIAILAKNCVEYLELYSACETAGFIIVPVNFRLSYAEIQHICDNTHPVVCFYTGEYENQIDSIKHGSESIRHFIRIDTVNTADDEYQELVNGGNAEMQFYVPLAQDPSCIIHTSGTTGHPKGAVLSQSALYGIADTISTDADISSDDYGLVMQPLFHVGAKFLQLAHHIRGATIKLEQGFEPANVWRILASEAITTMQLVPTMLDILLDEIEDGNYPETNLKTIFYSTAPIREALLRRGLEVFGQVFLQQYGSTEAGQITSLAKHHHINDGSEKEQKWLTSAGTANPGIDIAILNNEGEVLGAGEPGEISIRHPNIMQGYWNDEESTASTIVDGYLHMGDIGYLDEDGFLYIVDRKKDMIISGGENIYPREVESALLGHPAVDETAVIGIPDDRWGESVLAFIVCKQGESVSEEELIQYCKQQIASYKKPSAVKFLRELPRIATGKVDKVNLRKPYWAEQKRGVI
jgi:acyl-CoA synthetase (AMP-forming)/AMP-acid ligase II